MKKSILNIIILAIYSLLVAVLIIGVAMLASASMKYEGPEQVENEKFEKHEIMFSDEMWLYVGQKAVITPYLMSTDGSLATTRFHYKSDCEQIKVDQNGTVEVLADPGKEATVTIEDKTKAGVTKEVKIKIVSSLSSVLGVLTHDGHLITSVDSQKFILGTTYSLKVNTIPQGIDVEGLCYITVTDRSGVEKDAFEISYDKNNILLTPVGLGSGTFHIEIISKEGNKMYDGDMAFSIAMENSTISDTILAGSSETLMVGSDFDKVTKITIDSSIKDMNNLSMLSKLKTVIIDSSSVLSLKNINPAITYMVPVSVFSRYCDSSTWSSHIGSVLPYNPSNSNTKYIVYHDTRDDSVECVTIGGNFTFKQFDNYNGQKHTGWKDKDGNQLLESNVRYATESLHAYSIWSASEYTIVYHLRRFDRIVNENWQYGEQRAFKDVTTFTGYTAKKGYKFVGWTTSSISNPTADNVDYFPGTKYKNLASEDGAVIHVYDVWEVLEYTIAFDLPEGYTITTGNLNSINVTYGEEYILPDLTVSEKGYYFSGWQTTSGKTLNPGKNTAPLTDVDGETVHLMAKISEVLYFIKIDFNGGRGFDENGTEILEPTGTIRLKYTDEYLLPILEKDGVKMRYWVCSYNGNKYAPGSVISQIYGEVLEDSIPLIEFVAYW